MLFRSSYSVALDWILCNALTSLSSPEGTSTYLRLSTRPIDQAPFEETRRRLGDEALRQAVIAGGYRLRETQGEASVILATCGPVVPEVLKAAEILSAEGIEAVVLDITSSDRLYNEWRNGLRDATRTARKIGRAHV